MPEARVYHVRRCDDATWHVIKDGFKRPHFVRSNKKEAVLIARRLAKAAPEAKVVVHHDSDVDGEHHYEAA